MYFPCVLEFLVIQVIHIEWYLFSRLDVICNLEISEISLIMEMQVQVLSISHRSCDLVQVIKLIEPLPFSIDQRLITNRMEAFFHFKAILKFVIIGYELFNFLSYAI